MRCIVLVFLTICSWCVSAQTVVLNLPLGKGTAPKFQGIVSGDSIFVNLFQIGKSAGYWISPRGVRNIDLPELKEKSLFAVGRVDSAYYYFLTEEKKQLYINALVVKDGVRQFAKTSVPINARLYGAFVENGRLFLLMAEKSGYRLQLLEFTGLTLVNSRSFVLSFDLGKLKNSSVSFYNSAFTYMPPDAIAPIKIVKDKDALWITIDEPKPPYQAQPLDFFRTTVLRIDLISGETLTRMLPSKSEDFFNSIIHDGFLYRIVQESNYYLEVFKFDSGKKVGTYLEPQTADEQKDISVFVRDGLRSALFKQAKKKFGLNRGYHAFVLVDSVNTGSVLVSLGTHVESSPRMPLASNLGALGFAIPLVMNEVVLKSVEGPTTYVYTHFLIRSDELVSLDEPITRRQQIDAYELGFRASKKAYLHTPTHSYGLYLLSSFTQFQVVRFD